MAIVKWDPFRGIDRVFDDEFPLTILRNTAPNYLSVDVYEENGNVVAEMHIAGIKPEDIDISVEDNYLRVTGKKEEEKEEKEKNYYYKEINRGSFERTVRLPVMVKEEQAKATYEEGVLKITIPKEEEKKKHKKIQIEAKK